MEVQLALRYPQDSHPHGIPVDAKVTIGLGEGEPTASSDIGQEECPEESIEHYEA